MTSRLQRLQKKIKELKLDGFVVAKDENIFYLSHFTGTDSLLLVTGDKGYLITDFRYTEQAQAEAPEYDIVERKGSIWEAVADLARQLGLAVVGCEDALTVAQFQAMQEKLGSIPLKPQGGLVEKLRLIKDEAEIRNIKKAVELADEAFAHILHLLRPGISEKDVALELEFAMRRAGADKAAFDFIVASGPRGSLPHGMASTRVLSKGDLVTMDFGAVYHGYHSDITRTVVIGPPERRQEEIYGLVLEAQQAGLAAVQTGRKAADVDRVARQIIADHGYGDNFGHGLGHGVGLAIHEAPSLSPKGDDSLEEGMVVTVEPGIYLPGWGGVRIEDTVVVRPGGCEVLTRAPKKDLIIID